MATEFLYAEQLKKQFSCLGHFYRLSLPGVEMKCRSVLEIVSLQLDQSNPDAFWTRQADAVVIMMNPGKSRPSGDARRAEARTYSEATLAQKRLVPARPDPTLYQVMRLAAAREWSHVRVLNLSDLRCPNSMAFLEQVKRLRDIPGGGSHSLFSDEREAECAVGLNRRMEAVLLGWGQDKELLPLVKQCVGRLAGVPMVAVPSPVGSLLNAHPSPQLREQKEAWLKAMLMQLKGM